MQEETARLRPGERASVERIRGVREYQVARMRETHESLFRSPVYGALCEFFVEDLYGPRDRMPQHQTFRSLSRALRHILGKRAFREIERILELQRLSDALDDRLAIELERANADVEPAEDVFEAAFRACGNRSDRRRQLDLSMRCTAFVHDFSRRPAVDRLFRAIERFRGLDRLSSTLRILERGHQALRQVKDIAGFLRAMRRGELAYLEKIWGDSTSADRPS